MPAKYVLKKGTTGKFRFNLVATNGQVIATSEAYETRAKAMAGIESVRKNAANAVLVDGTAPAAKPAAKATAARKSAGTARPAGKPAASSSALKAAAKAPAKSTGPGASAVKAVKRAAKKVTGG
ncbi:MAG TPA: YegP family protein [Frankiaceae bacterium]|nr:YegP family protein [Frankiaceae bacterium]